MKKIIIASILLASIPSAYSQTAAETANEVAAQTKITRGYIDNLLEKVNNKTIDSNFKASDYLAQSQEYKNRVEAALKKFEETLEKDILIKAAFWMNQYNSIYKSKDISIEQKEVVLMQRRAAIGKEFEKLSASYQRAVRDVYGVIPFANSKFEIVFPTKAKTYPYRENFNEMIPVNILIDGKTLSTKINFLNDNGNFYVKTKSGALATRETNTGYADTSRVGWETVCNEFLLKRTCKTTVQYSDFLLTDIRTGAAIKNDLYNLTYEKHIYSLIKGSCKSSLCVALKSGDYLELSSMIKSMIDRDIYMTLADGHTLRIKTLNLDLQLVNWAMKIVEYPEDLPFDI